MHDKKSLVTFNTVVKHVTHPGTREPGGSGRSLPPQLWSRGSPCPTAHGAPVGLGTVGAVVVPKLGFVGHKENFNGRKRFSEKSLSFSGSVAQMVDKPFFEAATKAFSSLSCEGIPHLLANVFVFVVVVFFSLKRQRGEK